MQVVCSAEADIDHLFELGDPSEYDKHHARVMAGDLDIAVVSVSFISVLLALLKFSSGVICQHNRFYCCGGICLPYSHI